tara:strand:+ start:131 stop:367 length:237 start_codon:yes stop_codon:yes gene_type:complete
MTIWTGCEKFKFTQQHFNGETTVKILEFKEIPNSKNSKYKYQLYVDGRKNSVVYKNSNEVMDHIKSLLLKPYVERLDQ